MRPFSQTWMPMARWHKCSGRSAWKTGRRLVDTNGTAPLGEPVRVLHLLSADSFQSAGAPSGVGQPGHAHFPGGQEPVADPAAESADGPGGRWPSSIRYPGCLRQSLWGCRPDQPVRRLRRRRKRSQGGSRGRSDQDRIPGTLTIGGDIWACGGKGGPPSPSKRRIGSRVRFISRPPTSSSIRAFKSRPAEAAPPESTAETARQGWWRSRTCGRRGGRVYVEATTSLVNNASSC